MPRSGAQQREYRLQCAGRDSRSRRSQRRLRRELGWAAGCCDGRPSGGSRPSRLTMPARLARRPDTRRIPVVSPGLSGQPARRGGRAARGLRGIGERWATPWRRATASKSPWWVAVSSGDHVPVGFVASRMICRPCGEPRSPCAAAAITDCDPISNAIPVTSAKYMPEPSPVRGRSRFPSANTYQLAARAKLRCPSIGNLLAVT